VRILVKFGLDGYKKVVTWNKELLDFPKLLKYSGRKWEWFLYSTDPTMINDYEITLCEIGMHDPGYYLDIPDFEDLFGSSSKCECGARFSSFEWDHMYLCPLWKPW
jgi:hypothetical protein